MDFKKAKFIMAGSAAVSLISIFIYYKYKKNDIKKDIVNPKINEKKEIE